jgi:GrpB-like predicted nucleotidyltransferase (UPF0157 family)
VDRVELVPYDPSWPARFEEVAAQLRAALGPCRIEHIGSTAVPGLAAKPVIDVLVEVADVDDARTRAVPALLAAGYNEIYWRIDLEPGHFTCVKRDPTTFVRLEHVHLVPGGHPMWGAVAFRDLLRAHSGERTAYERLKRDLASRFPDDREAYTAAKASYVEELTARAQRIDRT